MFTDDWAWMVWRDPLRNGFALALMLDSLQNCVGVGERRYDAKIYDGYRFQNIKSFPRN